MPTPSETPSAPESSIARVAVEVSPFHLDRPFDYAVGEHAVTAGQLVSVRFAGRRVRGVVLDVVSTSSVDPSRLRTIERPLGAHVWVRPEELELWRWAAGRFGSTLADVMRHALPKRVIDVERRARERGWFPPGATPPPDWSTDLVADESAWSAYIDRAVALRDAVHAGRGSFFLRPRPGEDLGQRLIELATGTLAGGRDVLMIVPDQASPVGERVAEHFAGIAVDLRGAQSPRVRYRAWLTARCGQARVVVGERGAAFFPMERLGLAVVVDEANPALKERRSPRHHVREVVLERARRAAGVGLVTGTVPSAAAWRLLRDRRLAAVIPTRDAERAARPRVRIVDWQRQPRTRLAKESLQALRTAYDAGAYGVVLATRRGEGRFLVCRACATRSSCRSCTSTLGRSDGAFHCDVCGWRGRTLRCDVCGATDFVPVAAGTSWIAAEIRRSLKLPTVALEGYAPDIPPPPMTLVATRGAVLDAPPGPVGAVVLADFDAALRRPVLDAAEDTLRLAMALATWTVSGNPTSPGIVILQTREPDHPAVVALERWDPARFWAAEASARAVFGFPPARQAIRLVIMDEGAAFAAQVRAALPDTDDVLGPIIDRDRQELLITCDNRAATLTALHPLRAGWSAEGLEVRLDVDPVDT